MLDFFLHLFDEAGFVPRRMCGSGWTPEMIWLHVGSDLFIWLAYMSIPLVLIYFTRRRNVPFNYLFILFALFITACGLTHLVDALMFERPMYRISGFVKAITAFVSWATVIALIRVAPRVSELLSTAGDAQPETAIHRPLGRSRQRYSWATGYIVGILAGVLAVLIRAAMDPFMRTDHGFVLGLVAVVYVSWQRGFGPAMVALVVSMFGVVFFFVDPRTTLIIGSFSDQMAAALFFFCGVACAGLGEAQRHAQKHSRRSLALALAQKEELEIEVTRRRMVEGALRQREADLLSLTAQLDGFLLNAPVGIAFFDTDLRYVRVNRVFAEVNRRSSDSHIGKKTGELARDFPRELENDFAKVLNTGKTILDRHFIAGPESSSPGTHWRLNLFPVRVRDGGTVGLGVIGQDVTERERAAAILRENEERFRTLADNMPVLIWLSDDQMKRTYFNRTWLAFVGRSMEQELGDGWRENVHPKHLDRYLRVYQAAFEARTPFEIEYLLRRRDGEHRWVLARGTPWTSSDGVFQGFVGLCLDITDRKVAQDQIRDSAERFRTLTEAIPQLVWNANSAGHITYFNTRWRDYTGLTVGAALDEWWPQIVHPDDAGEIQSLWRRCLTDNPSQFIHEVRIRRAADGVYRWFKTALVPLRGADGAVDQWIGSLTDIEDEKQQSVVLEQKVEQRTAELMRITGALREEIEDRVDAETKVRAVARELERSNGELEKFAYVASHDLQEPLRKIQAFGDRLRERCRDEVSEQGRDYIDRMLASAGRMRKLIDDLLAFSRVTTHARPFEMIDLNVVFHDAADDLAALVERTGGTLDVGPLPTLEADPSQIHQLFQNLLTNALKFHRPGTPPVVTVRSELLAAPGQTKTYQVTVSDNGIGFDEKYLGRIFEVFQRLHGREEYEGTGVGLAICKKIVERHRGKLTAKSKPDEGATFVITLPERQAEAAVLP